MICRLFVAAFFSLLNIGTVYPILYLHKKALTRHKAASEPTMYFIDVLYKTNLANVCQGLFSESCTEKGRTKRTHQIAGFEKML